MAMMAIDYMMAIMAAEAQPPAAKRGCAEAPGKVPPHLGKQARVCRAHFYN